MRVRVCACVCEERRKATKERGRGAISLAPIEVIFRGGTKLAIFVTSGGTISRRDLEARRRER